MELPLIYQGISGSKRYDMAMEGLERVAMGDRANHRPARAIATKAPIIMADEPTGALDSRTGAHVLEILHGLHEEGTTIILITHDSKIASTAERIVKISDGKIIMDCPREEAGAL